MLKILKLVLSHQFKPNIPCIPCKVQGYIFIHGKQDVDHNAI